MLSVDERDGVDVVNPSDGLFLAFVGFCILLFLYSGSASKLLLSIGLLPFTELLEELLDECLFFLRNLKLNNDFLGS